MSRYWHHHQHPPHHSYQGLHPLPQGQVPVVQVPPAPVHVPVAPPAVPLVPVHVDQAPAPADDAHDNDVFSHDDTLALQRVIFPKTIQGLHAGYLPHRGQQLLTSDDVRMRSSAYSERYGRLAKCRQSNRNRIEYCCHYSTRCRHVIRWKKDESKWLCSSVVPHSCSSWPVLCDGEGGSCTNYTAKQLAPALMSAADTQIRRGGASLSAQTVTELIRPYVTRSPNSFPPSFIFRTKREAYDMVNGAQKDQASLIAPLKRLLEEDGHLLDVVTVGKEQQKAILLDLAKKEFDLLHKNDEPPRPRFSEPPDLYDVLDEYDDDTKFLYAVKFSPSYAGALAAKLRGVRSFDAYHMKTSLGGTAFATWGVTANNNIVCLGLTWYADNECHPCWAGHIETVKQRCPAIDSHGHYNIVDGDKGYSAAHDEHFNLTKKFLCVVHKADHVAKRGGKSARALYKKAVKATTQEALNAVKAEYKPITAEYLARHPDDELYMFATGGKTYGRSASQLAESGGNAIDAFRRAYPLSGLVIFIRDEFDRLMKMKRAADERKETLTPAATAHLQRLEAQRAQKNNEHGKPVVRPASRSHAWAEVASATVPGKSYDVTEGKGCSCGSNEVLGEPCVHELEAVRQLAHKQPEDVYRQHWHTSAWKEEMAAVPDLRPVNVSRLVEMARGEEVLPKVKKRPKGRPKNQKRLIGMVERQKIAGQGPAKRRRKYV